MIHIVKRKGHKEKFDERKVYASCYEACLSCCHYNKKEAEKICEKVTKSIKAWIKNKEQVSSREVFKTVTKEIKKHSKEAAFMYETHRDIS